MTKPLDIAQHYKPYKCALPIYYPGGLGVDLSTARALRKKDKKKEVQYRERKKGVETDTDVARRLGLNDRFFSTMKNGTPKRYRAIKLLGKGDLEKGMKAYEIMFKRTEDYISDITDAIRRNRHALRFSLEFYNSKYKVPSFVANRRSRSIQGIERLFASHRIAKDYEKWLATL